VKAYGFKCKKCDCIVEDTSTPFLVYAKNGQAATQLLQDSIKEHDIMAHGDDQHFPSFKIIVFFQRA
jgi:hypothetical protein